MNLIVALWRARCHKVIATAVCCAVLGATLLAASRQVRIYVFTQPAEFNDEESKRRNDSVSDLKGALSKKFALVDKREDADLLLEVISSRWEIRGKTAIIDPEGESESRDWLSPLWGRNGACCSQQGHLQQGTGRSAPVGRE